MGQPFQKWASSTILGCLKPPFQTSGAGRSKPSFPKISRLNGTRMSKLKFLKSVNLPCQKSASSTASGYVSPKISQPLSIPFQKSAMSTVPGYLSLQPAQRYQDIQAYIPIQNSASPIVPRCPSLTVQKLASSTIPGHLSPTFKNQPAQQHAYLSKPFQKTGSSTARGYLSLDQESANYLSLTFQKSASSTAPG